MSGENASMNLQTLPRSAQPAGSSGLADDKQARKRITDKIRRDKRKCKLEEDVARIKEFKEKKVELELENAVLKAEANQLAEHLDQLRNISEKMAFKDARRNAKLEKDVDGSMQKIEDTERQLEKVRADYDELKKSYDELNKAHAYSNGLVDQARKDMEQIAGFNKGLQQIVERQNAWNDMHQQPLVAGTTGIDTGEIGLPVHHPTINQSGATMESGGPVNAESWPQLHQVGQPYYTWSNNVEQPPLSGGGWTPGADLFGSHGLNYTSPPGAAMVSSSSLMEGTFAPGGQLPVKVTGFSTGETGLPVPHSPIHHFETTMGSGGLAFEDSPGLLQSVLSQGWTHGNNSEQPTSYNADQFPAVN